MHSFYILAGFISYALAIDPSTGNIFYAAVPYTFDAPYSYIGVLKPHSQKHFTLYRDEYQSIYTLVIHPAKG